VATGDGVHYLDPGVYLVRYSGKTAKLMVQ
jgi:hypothetical protein